MSLKIEKVQQVMVIKDQLAYEKQVQPRSQSMSLPWDEVAAGVRLDNTIFELNFFEFCYCGAELYA